MVVSCSYSVGSVLQCVGAMQKMSILQNNDGRCMLNICSVPIYMPISSVKYQMMSNHLGAGKPYGRWRITTGNTKQTLFSCQGPKLIWSKVQVVHRETVVITETNEYYDQSKRKTQGEPRATVIKWTTADVTGMTFIELCIGLGVLRQLKIREC